MLVDLARNDLARVCEAGSVEVLDFMQVERYSHVMHLVSTVVGRLRRRTGRRSTRCVATFPAGTLSGAPKVRAMELIDEMETTRRGAVRRDGRLPGLRRRPGHGHRHPHGGDPGRRGLRAGRRRRGRGLRPVAEYQESVNKSMAVLRAVAAASGLRTPST